MYEADTRATARYINPNAECPVCGASVFFYQNEFGSRVYFDELGPPWPKHPCTDQSHGRKARSERIEPALRPEDEYSLVASSLDKIGSDLLDRFRQEYGSALWIPHRVERRFRGRSRTVLLISGPNDGAQRLRFLSARRLPVAIRTRSIVYFKRGQLSYFDMKRMSPAEIKVNSFRNAAEFARSLAEPA